MDRKQDGKLFIFGSGIFPIEIERDKVCVLPLELSWKIFSYLDGESLKLASLASKIWKNIILSNKMLRKRLNIFVISSVKGSETIAKFYLKHKRRMKSKTFKKTFLPVKTDIGMVPSPSNIVAVGKKRKGDSLTSNSKRVKL